MQSRLISSDRTRNCPFCTARVNISRLTCPHCKGRIYTELVRQEGGEVQEIKSNRLSLTEPPELKNDSPYILCKKGTTIKFMYQRKVHALACIHKCNQVFRCPAFRDALSDRGLIQFQEIFTGASDAKKKKVGVIPFHKKQRNRTFITFKKTDWRDIRTAIGESQLAEYRNGRKMTATSMADKLGLTLPSYQRLENGNAHRVRRRLLAEIEAKIVQQESQSHGH